MSTHPEPAPVLFALSESRRLGESVSEHAGVPLGLLEERQYDGGEFKLRPLQPVRDRTVFVVQSLAETASAPTALRLVRLLFLLQCLKDAGAASRIVVVPYLAYARKDRRTRPRDPVYTRYLAQLMECAGADRVVALDVHNASSIDNAFRIPVDHLSAGPMMVAHFAQRLVAGVPVAVASPDIGGVKRAQVFQELLERRTGSQCGLVFIEKRREGTNISGGTVVGNVQGRAVIVLDDLCASGTTLIKAATALRAAGAASVSVAVTHVPLPAGSAALVAAGAIDHVVITDSVGDVPMPTAASNSERSRVKVLAAGELLGCAIGRMVRGQPVATLGEQWPPED